MSLVDVSGSMAGVPMEVSIALGLLVSDLADEPFKHRVLTFESQPRWHKIPSTSSPVEQIRNLQRAPWGGSTNFAAAMDLLLAACVDGNVQAEDVPDLIVSATCSSTRPTVRGGRRTTSGYQGNGREEKATSCRRSRTGICGATRRAASCGRRFVSRACGCSRAFLAGPAEVGAHGRGGRRRRGEVTVDGVSRAKPTPYETMRRALDAPRYDAVRTMLSEFDGAPFADYTLSRRRRRTSSSSTRRRRLPGPLPRRTPLLAPAYHFYITIFQETRSRGRHRASPIHRRRARAATPIAAYSSLASYGLGVYFGKVVTVLCASYGRWIC